MFDGERVRFMQGKYFIYVKFKVLIYIINIIIFKLYVEIMLF